MRGKKYISPAVAEQLAHAFDRDSERPAHELLSDREFDVFMLLAKGKSVSNIASQLFLSGTTVSTYRARIMIKMNMTVNAELTRYALELKLL